MNKRSALLALILLVIGAIVGGGIWLSLWHGGEPSVDRSRSATVEGKLVKEDYASAVTWVIETKDGEKYELQGSQTDEIADLGEGTELRTEGYIEESAITSPDGGGTTNESRYVINVTDYKILGEAAGEQAETTTLTGTFLVLWGDPPDPGLPPKQILKLTDDQGKETEIKITPDTVFIDGYNVYYYSLKKVNITGDLDSKLGILTATSIEVAQ